MPVVEGTDAGDAESEGAIEELKDKLSGQERQQCQMKSKHYNNKSI